MYRIIYIFDILTPEKLYSHMLDIVIENNLCFNGSYNIFLLFRLYNLRSTATTDIQNCDATLKKINETTTLSYIFIYYRVQSRVDARSWCQKNDHSNIKNGSQQFNTLSYFLSLILLNLLSLFYSLFLLWTFKLEFRMKLR